MQEDATELDLRGLRCPLPALRAGKALRHAEPGRRLLVLCDDPLARLDIPHLCQTDGHRLVESLVVEGHVRFLIEARREAGTAEPDQVPGSE